MTPPPIQSHTIIGLMRTPSVTRPLLVRRRDEREVHVSTSPVCTDGVPMPSVLFGNVEIAGAYDAEVVAARARSRTSAETVRLLRRRVDVVRAEVGDRVARRPSPTRPRRSRTSRFAPYAADAASATAMQHDAEVHDEPAVAAAGSPRIARPSATATTARPARAGGRGRRRTNWRTMPASANAPSPNASTVGDAARAEHDRDAASSSAPTHAGTSSRSRSTSPLVARHGSAGADRHEEQQREADRRGHAVEVRLADREPAALQRLGEQREHRAEQHDEREPGEQQVVGEERRLARHRRVDAPGRAQLVAAPRDEPDAGRGDDAEEREQPRPDVGLA